MENTSESTRVTDVSRAGYELSSNLAAREIATGISLTSIVLGAIAVTAGIIMLAASGGLLMPAAVPLMAAGGTMLVAGIIGLVVSTKDSPKNELPVNGESREAEKLVQGNVLLKELNEKIDVNNNEARQAQYEAEEEFKQSVIDAYKEMNPDIFDAELPQIIRLTQETIEQKMSNKRLLVSINLVQHQLGNDFVNHPQADTMFGNALGKYISDIEDIAAMRNQKNQAAGRKWHRENQALERSN